MQRTAERVDFARGGMCSFGVDDAWLVGRLTSVGSKYVGTEGICGIGNVFVG